MSQKSVRLVVPKDGPRVAPLQVSSVSPYVAAEYDKAVRTWGIPNNLIKTMACLPQLALTEVAYANSFIFDEGALIAWPRPGSTTPGDSVLFPAAGFVDRVTKELVINLVSLLNRSRYSITHHTVIGFNTLKSSVAGPTEAWRAQRAEAMLLHLVDHSGKPDFEAKQFGGTALYDEFELATLRLSVKIRSSPHAVTDEEFAALRVLCERRARAQISAVPALLSQFGTGGPDAAFVRAYVDAMLVELIWCIVHFCGLLNAWFTVLRVRDESDVQRDGVDFVTYYETVVPESIKVRNNNLLGVDGWGAA